MYIYDGTTFTLIADKTCYKTATYITSAGWASFSSKFEVAIPEGITAYIASKKGESTVTMTELSGTIPANTGVVLSGNAGTYEAAITQTGATLSETNYLLPWLTEGTPTEDVYYTLAVSEGNPVFKKSNGYSLWDDDSEE